MPQALYSFIPGFLWGSATAAHQVEGNNTNNTWWAWEQQPGRIINGDKSGLACDWWSGRWKQDFDRAAETGQNAHRLSVEWSRIQPEAERWDDDALDYYRQILRGAVERGLTPMITLHHFSDPLWLAERGAWENEETPRLFAAYVSRVVEALKEYCNLWVTINEPNVYVPMGYLFSVFPPGKTDLKTAYLVMANMLRGHAAAYRAIHQQQKTARVGFSHNQRPFRPRFSLSPLDRFVSKMANQVINYSFPNAVRDGRFDFFFWKQRIPEAAGTQDFFGLNYYTTAQIGFTFSPRTFFVQQSFPRGAEVSSSGFLSNDPAGLFNAIRWARRFNVPIIITENGVEDTGDDLRPRYLIEHVHQLWRAVNYSWPVKGYFYWSLVDNFEWERGWTQKFGLWGLDPQTQARQRRASVDVYADICKNNGISSEMVARLAPSLMEKLFPG